MNLEKYLKEKAEIIERALVDRLPSENTVPHVIHQAMRYSCLGGGKRLRAILALEACSAVGGNPETVLDFACAIEMIHAYSLIHDDLPAMDDDDYRRGKLTNHKVYGEGIAVLAGDALLTHAFEILTYMSKYLDAEMVVQIIKEVSEACGSQGLIGGQVVDLKSEGENIDLNTLEYIYQNKTGKLILVALRGGAIIGGATAQQLAAVTLYGENFGLAFQITDDILDVVGDTSKLGKEVGADLRRQKSTYPSLFGLTKAREIAKNCISQCEKALVVLPKRNDYLHALARFVLEREY
ncbi:MAG: polyprenyl synthetase family protein [Firmicutes bacterium]|nr:polyprenyl synthetase family protein [Bacillota bacterium]